MSTEALLLTPEEILALTGYRQPAAQLAELRRQGFQRARRNPAGTVVLERDHYVAVCAGQYGVSPSGEEQPKLRSQRAKHDAGRRA